MNIPDHISESLETIVWVKKYPNSWTRILGSGMEKVEFGINIPDPQHWILPMLVFSQKYLKNTKDIKVIFKKYIGPGKTAASGWACRRVNGAARRSWNSRRIQSCVRWARARAFLHIDERSSAGLWIRNDLFTLSRMARDEKDLLGRKAT
jgi:hypothetical protein